MRNTLFVMFAVSGTSLANPACLRALASATRFPQEASVHMLRATIEAPHSQEHARVYADTLDQDFTPTPRQQAEANAIRLALKIESDGGPDNPFDDIVTSPEVQRQRLARHPRGAELLDLWNRAGWGIPAHGPRNPTGVIFRRGLPRELVVTYSPDWSDYPPGFSAARLRLLEGLAARMPSVCSIHGISSDGQRVANRWDEWMMGLRGHMGLRQLMASELNALTDAMKSGIGTPDTETVRRLVRELIFLTASRWLYENDRTIAPDLREPLERFVSSLGPDARRLMETWLRWLDDGPPRQEDFVGAPGRPRLRPGDPIPDTIPLVQMQFIVVGQERFMGQIVIPRLERYLATLAASERETFLAQFFAEMHDADPYFLSRTLPDNTRDGALAGAAMQFAERAGRRR